MKFELPKKVDLSDKSLYEYLREFAFDCPLDVFLLNEEMSLSTIDVLKKVEGLACEFFRLGVKRGDYIALRTTRSIETVIVMLSLHLLGAVEVLCDPSFKVREFIDRMDIGLKPDFFLSDENGNWELTLNNESSICKSIKPHENYLVDNNVVSAMRLSTNVHAPSIIVFTSGSTGKSKGVVQSEYVYINNSVEGQPTQGHEDNDRSIAILPLFHIFGIAIIANALVTRHSVFFPKEVSVDYVLKSIQDYSVTRMYSVPTYFLAMIADGKHKNYDLTKFRFGLIAGGPNTPEQYEQMEKELGIRIVIVYGMSEFFGISRTTYDMPFEMRSVGVGTFNPHVEGHLLDDEGNEVPYGKQGEVCVKGYPLMLGYYNNHKETEMAIDKNGLFHTGDLGFYDENGILHLSGRKKDIIIRGGENISALKVENALLSVQEVQEAVVVGKKDAFFGEVPVAVVVLKSNASITEDELKSKLKGILLAYELPVEIRFTDKIFKTSTEKPDKIKIKEMFN